MTRAPRIDTLRNQLTATIELLAMARDELEDLHTLAYDRPTARSEIVVSGGAPDYALDNHGDTRARNAYRLLGDKAIEAAKLLADAAHGAISILREDDGDDRARTGRTINRHDLADAIEAQGRRITRGEFVPVRRLPQPGTTDVVKELRTRLDRQRRLAKELERERDDARAEATRLRSMLNEA